MLFWTSIIIALGLILVYNSKRANKQKVGIVLGSGGHTAEMIITLKKTKLTAKAMSKIYIIKSSSDNTSIPKLFKEIPELSEMQNIQVINIIRSRKVGQSYITSVFTTLLSIVQCLSALMIQLDLLICNGPGTCIPVVLVLKLYNMFRLKVIFIESFCRVKSLSLSGKIIYHLRVADEFLVHWEDLEQKYNRLKYKGQLF